MRTLLVLAFLLSTSFTLAQTGVYRSVEPDGTVIFSDQPRPGAEKVDLKPTQTVAPPEPVRQVLKPESREREQTGEAAYTKFAIVSPSADESVRSNNGNVTVSLSLSPELRAQHAIVVSMNGEQVGKGTSTSLTLQNLPRGTHTVQAVVVDASGAELIRAQSVSFHLLRRTKKLPPPKPQPL